MKIYGYVEKGLGKAECQDRVLIGDTILAGGFLVYESGEHPNLLIAVADGVGGYAGGEKASLLAVDGIRVLNRRSNLMEEDVRSLVEFTNEQIKGTAQMNAALSNMATTLTALVMNQEKALTVHIGNCRLCSYKKYMQQITKDQTVVAEMVARGEITLEEAKVSPLRNQISACLGGGADRFFASLLVESQERLVTQESNLILTSDGVHDYLNEEELEEMLCSDKEIYQLCTEIAKNARKNGSTDDISIVLVDRMGKYEPKATETELPEEL